MVLYNGNPIIFGGLDDEGTLRDGVYLLDVESKSASDISVQISAPAGRVYHAGVIQLNL